MNKEQLAELDAMSGSSQQGNSLIVLDEVSLNGKEGTFSVKLKTKEKVKEGSIEKFQKEELGKEIVVVFLKKRRKLVQRGKKGATVRATSEHSTPTDVVTLSNYEGGTNEVGRAVDLRAKYPEMRTNEVMYAMNFVNGEVFRLILKGSSLHMQEEVKGITLFYDYIKGFTGEDRFYMYETVLEPMPVEGELGTIYATNFKRGRKITDEEFKIVAENIKKFNANTVAYDLKNAQGGQISTPSAPVEELESIDYGEVDDESAIPF